MKDGIGQNSIILLILIPLIQTLLSLYWRGIGDTIATFLFIIFLIISSTSFWKNSYIMFIISSVIGFISEYIGLHYGVIFGSYEYIGFKHAIILNVPIPIIFAWGIYIIYSYITAHYITSRLRWLYSSIILVILDLAIDPIMVANHIWIWYNSGNITWFGVPLTNYLGWFIVPCISIILYEKFYKPPEMKIYIKLSIPALYSLYLPLIVVANPGVYSAIVYSIIILTSFIGVSLYLNRKVGSKSCFK